VVFIHPRPFARTHPPHSDDAEPSAAECSGGDHAGSWATEAEWTHDSVDSAKCSIITSRSFTDSSPDRRRSRIAPHEQNMQDVSRHDLASAKGSLSLERIAVPLACVAHNGRGGLGCGDLAGKEGRRRHVETSSAARATQHAHANCPAVAAWILALL
jgi:hypothetical protein